MRRLSKKKIILAAAAGVTVLAAVYMGLAWFFQSHFCFGTVVDGIRVGGCSAARVEKLITEQINRYSLTLLEREGSSESIAGDSIGLAPVFQGEVEELLKEQNGFAWIAVLFRGADLTLSKVVAYDEDALENVLDSLSCLEEKNQRAPVDASYSEYSKETGYVLVPADYGTAVNRGALKQALKDAVSVLQEELDLDESGCYEDPEVGDDHSGLLGLIDTLNAYVGMTITYEFGDETEVLDGEIISTWLSQDKWKAVVDEEAVLDYVKSLGKKYNTAYQSKTLETSYGQTVTISGGFYGWRIDNGGEVEQILADLKEGESVTREPVYLQTANSHGENDYGDSYVEINLTAQHLFVYENGKLVIESDFVSGNVAKGNSTPTGAFGLTYKTTNAILRGPDYETPVNYWMPFNGDVGMHDATWRKSFGGNIYKTNGSHGCINLPFAAAKTIYETVNKGYAVLVYTLPGTESQSTQKKDASTVAALIDSIGTVTLESETVIVNARNLYNALPDAAKQYVTNYNVLTAAESALEQLKNSQQPAGQQPQQPAEQQPQQPQAPGQHRLRALRAMGRPAVARARHPRRRLPLVRDEPPRPRLVQPRDEPYPGLPRTFLLRIQLRTALSRAGGRHRKPLYLTVRKYKIPEKVFPFADLRYLCK